VTDDLREIVLEDIPVPAFWRLQRHQDDLLRELAVLDLNLGEASTAGIPADLVEVVTDLRTRYAGARALMLDELAAAAERGEATATVRLTVPVAAAPVIAHTCQAYEAAEELCRAGTLMTTPAPAEVAALRRRLCDEIVRALS
jgi:hypothetical protein